MSDSSIWQPISTAPRDGTYVLLYAESWSMSWGEVQMGHFSGGVWHTGEGSVDDNDPDFDPNAEVDDDWEADGSNEGPTHWMSLPKPPSRERAS